MLRCTIAFPSPICSVDPKVPEFGFEVDENSDSRGEPVACNIAILVTEASLLDLKKYATAKKSLIFGILSSLSVEPTDSSCSQFKIIDRCGFN